jgi:hypothetical protein
VDGHEPAASVTDPPSRRACDGEVAAVAPLANLATQWFSGLAGFTNRRPLLAWQRNHFIDRAWPKSGEREVVLLVDTFNRYFEPENARAAVRVLYGPQRTRSPAHPNDPHNSLWNAPNPPSSVARWPAREDPGHKSPRAVLRRTR